VTIGSSS